MSALASAGHRAAFAPLWGLRETLKRLPVSASLKLGARLGGAYLALGGPRADVARDAFTDRYTGVRISSTGARFLIKDAFVWNVLDAHGVRIGQAATFDAWEPVTGRR